MNIKYIVKRAMAGAIFLLLCSCLTVHAENVNPKNVEIPIQGENITSTSEELDPTTIVNMNGLLPDDSQIAALSKVPGGEGSIIESESTGGISTPEGKEFYIIETNAGGIFYLIIDHAKSSENVYFLSPINADILMASTEEIISEPEENKNELSGILQSNGTEAETDAEEKEEAENRDKQDSDSQKNTKKENSRKSGNAILIIIIIAFVSGGGYYVKIYKPKKMSLDEALDLETDFEGIEGEQEEEFFEEDVAEEEETEDDNEPERIQRSNPHQDKNINRRTNKKTNSPTTSIGTAIGFLGKAVLGFILVGLVSLGLTVLTNDGLRTMIMETIKNYF